MKTSKRETRDNLAQTSVEPLDALEHLANLRDDPTAFERFACRWPDFAYVLGDKEAARLLDDAPSANTAYYPTKYRGLLYGDEPARMPPNLPKRFLHTWQRREALREIWKGNTEKLTLVLFGSVWDVFAEPGEEWPWPPRLKVDWQRGEFVYTPGHGFNEAVYKLFRRSALAKTCANPDCPAPFFIAARTTQQYCSEKCSGVLQRANKLRWWKEHGPEWRRKRSRGKRGKR